MEDANALLRDNQYNEAAASYVELSKKDKNPAIRHNLAIAQVFGGSSEGLETIEALIHDHPQHKKTLLLSAALHKMAARAFTPPDDEHVQKAIDVLQELLQYDQTDPQSHILASEVYALRPECKKESITCHINALANIKKRFSVLSPSFVKVFMEDTQAGQMHFFDLPPDEAITTGSLPAQALKENRCLAILGNTKDLGLWSSWPIVYVTHHLGPAATGSGRMHVRTPSAWAARFQAARMMLEAGIETGVVWDTAVQKQVPFHPDAMEGNTSLITTMDGCDALRAFMYTSDVQFQRHMLATLLHPTNVPPASPTIEMANATFNLLAKDKDVDVSRFIGRLQLPTTQ